MNSGDTLRGQFRIQSVAGESGTGKIYSGIDGDGEPVLVRELDVKRLRNWDDVGVFEKTAMFLKSLSHPGLPRFVDFFSEEAWTTAGYFLVYKCGGGRPIDRWAADESKRSGEGLKKALVSTLEILDYLHSNVPPGVCPDIAADRILVREDGTVSLCCADFPPPSPSHGRRADIYKTGRIFAVALGGVYGAGESPMKEEIAAVLSVMTESPTSGDTVTASRLIAMIRRTGGGSPGSGKPAEQTVRRDVSPRTGTLTVKEGRRFSSLTAVNEVSGRSESLLPQLLLSLWLSKPWIVIIILSAVTGGSAFIPLLIMNYHPGARDWMKRMYSRYSEVEVNVDEDTLSVPNQLERTRLDQVERIDYETVREGDTYRLKVEVTQSGGEAGSFYLSGLSEDESLRVRDFIDRRTDRWR